MSLPEHSTATLHASDNIATFEIDANLPGRLLEGSPRHGNDLKDISDIEILPTRNEVESQSAEYLPAHSPRQLHLTALQGLIDRQFRLLGEDTVGQLRDAVRCQVQELRGSQQGHATAARDQRGNRAWHIVACTLRTSYLAKTTCRSRCPSDSPRAWQQRRRTREKLGGSHQSAFSATR
jgi:hypothetical protein